MCWESQAELPCDPTAAAGARGFCRERLSQVVGVGTDARECVEDALLVTSELVTNAIKADCGHTVVAINVHRGHVRISVEDDGQGNPQIQHPPPSVSHGRGLQIVQQLSEEWGFSSTAAGKQVWADLAIPMRLTGHLDCALPHPA